MLEVINQELIKGSLTGRDLPNGEGKLCNET
jgi:hypothetical protein